MSDFLTIVSKQFGDCCFRQRYRTAWLTGSALSGKSALARRLCEHNNWHYLDYTLTPGYFDTLATTIQIYQYEQCLLDLQNWCADCKAPVLVVDELDALLARWSHDQRHAWANKVSRLAYLPCGLVLVSHFFDCNTLVRYLPDQETRYCLNLPGALL